VGVLFAAGAAVNDPECQLQDAAAFARSSIAHPTVRARRRHHCQARTPARLRPLYHVDQWRVSLLLLREGIGFVCYLRSFSSLFLFLWKQIYQTTYLLPWVRASCGVGKQLTTGVN
jgi:hypothetical protein